MSDAVVLNPQQFALPAALAATIDDIRSYRGEVVASFENEPGNANMFLAAFPDALHVLLQTIHSPGAEPPRPELILTPDFLMR